MKSLALIIAALVIGCDNRAAVNDRSDGSLTETQRSAVYHGEIYDYTEVTAIDVEGCRYILVDGYSGTVSVVHAGNCPNPNHAR